MAKNCGLGAVRLGPVAVAAGEQRPQHPRVMIGQRDCGQVGAARGHQARDSTRRARVWRCLPYSTERAPWINRVRR